MTSVRIPSEIVTKPLYSRGKLFLEPALNIILLPLLGLFLLLGYGFMQVNLFGIPIAEIALVCILLMINHQKVLPRFFSHVFCLPLLIWWFFGLAHVGFDFQKYGTLAIRDGSHIIESLFLYIGFAYGCNQKNLNKLAMLLPYFLGLILFYSLTYPFRDILQPFSPALTGFGGKSVSLFFNYTNTGMLLLTATAYFLVEHFHRNKNTWLCLAIFCATTALLLFPSRTLILESLILMLFYILFFNKSKTKKILLFLTASAFILALVPIFGISINGRLGNDFQPQDYLSLFSEIFSNDEDPSSSLSSGNQLRLEWWGEIINNWSASFVTILFGLGYGQPLMNFVNNLGVAVREPHNELIGILGRGGLMAILSFLWFQAIIFLNGLKSMHYFNDSKAYGGLITFLFWIVIFTLVNGIGESPFCMSHYSVPFYCASGILLRIYVSRKSLHDLKQSS